MIQLIGTTLFHITGQIDVHSNISVIDCHCRDRCLHHHPYKTKICIELPKSIMLTQRATHVQLTIPSSSLTWPDCYFRAGKTIMICAKVATDLATQDHSWGMANCVAHCVARCVDLMLSGLQYRLSPCRGDDVGINHYNGNLWLKCWSEYWSSPWCSNVLVSHSISQIQSRQTHTHRCVQYDNKN